MWLDRCQVMVRQPTLAKFVCTFETVSWLVKEGFATSNENYMDLLYKMADDAGIPRPQLEVGNENYHNVIPPMIYPSHLPPPDASLLLQSTTHPDILSVLNWQKDQLVKLQETVMKLLNTPAQRLSEQDGIHSPGNDGDTCEEQSMTDKISTNDHTNADTKIKQDQML